ncbi:MAG: hypothetical protein AAGA02_13740 [Bacteroidota bacterium]
MFKVPGFLNFNAEAKDLRIIKSRNKAASHSVNYNENGIKDYYKISQCTLTGYGESLHIIGENDSEYQVNLKDDLITFNKFMASKLSDVCSFLIKRSFANGAKNKLGYYNDLLEIDAKAQGALIINSFDGKNKIVDLEDNEMDNLDSFISSLEN